MSCTCILGEGGKKGIYRTYTVCVVGDKPSGESQRVREKRDSLPGREMV